MWSRRFDCCKKCGTTDRSHGGLGFCNRCYQTRNSTGKINRNRRFSVDDYLFHGEWTEKSSYLYGVLYSDGNISKTAHKICIGLSVRDLEWLESLKLLFGTEVKLCISEISRTGRYCARLTFSSKQMHARLIQLGLKKTTPVMSMEMSRHFVRGLFDGDGSAFVSKQNGLLRFSLVGKKFVCDWVIERFREFTGLSSKVGPYRKTNTEKVVSIQMAGSAAIGFGQMIYGTQTVECLARKKQIWRNQKCLLNTSVSRIEYRAPG